ncbi:hypothetical protein DFH28DRAFT_364977 [Melampsora americana]|nr:hypothetical protein DFH28DRAFT_364977 [Melampsora americana]
MGDYINLEKTGPNTRDINAHLAYIKGLHGNPVWQIALMPYQGLESVTQDVVNSIAETMLRINNQGITVWLRFAHEMNGDWYKWGMKPKLFLEKWKMVWQAIKSKTSGTHMLWAPNSLFGGLNDVKGGYKQYWPGAQYVDMLVCKLLYILCVSTNTAPIHVNSETSSKYNISIK